MMHVCVVDTKRLVDTDGSKYEAFAVHVNGAFHAHLRYSQLLRLHQALTQTDDVVHLLPPFPPKKIRHHLSERQLEERRLGLHKYLQGLATQPALSGHPLVQRFLLEAQKTSFRPSSTNVSLDVLLPDGASERLRCPVDAPSSAVLRIVAAQLGLREDSAERFALLLVLPHQDPKRPPKLVRWLRDLESPYISLQVASQRGGQLHKLALRRAYWDLAIEQRLVADPAALRLVFAQALADVAHGPVRPAADVLARLKALEKEGCRKDFLALASLQPHYGLMELEPGTSDYPAEGTATRFLVGNRHLLLLFTGQDGEPQEAAFKLTRVRTWKLLYQPHDKTYLFSLEYMMARGRFEWVSLELSQPVLLCECLQSMGAEILAALQHSPQHSPASTLTSTSSVASSSAGSSASSASSSKYLSFKDMFPLTRNAEPSSPTTNNAFDTFTDDDL